MIRVMYEPLRFDVLSLFPETLKGFTSESIIGRACEHGLIDVQSLDLRNWASGGSYYINVRIGPTQSGIFCPRLENTSDE